MEINPFDNIPGLRTSRDAQEAAGDPNELGQDAFLELMTTQLANQDPLAPLENGEFLGQIAQFGTVSGITGLLASFEDLSANLQSSQALQASNLIGREVLVNHDQGFLPTEGSLNGAVDLASSSSNVALNVFDETGEVLARVELGEQPPGLVEFAWDGTTLTGVRAPAGRYRIEVEATFGSSTESITPQIVDRVQSLTLGRAGQSLQVELENIGSVGFNQVNQIQ